MNANDDNDDDCDHGDCNKDDGNGFGFGLQRWCETDVPSIGDVTCRCPEGKYFSLGSGRKTKKMNVIYFTKSE